MNPQSSNRPTAGLWFQRILAVSVLALAMGRVPAQDGMTGSDLAAELRRQRPTGDLTNSGTLRVRDGSGRRHTVPVRITTRGGSGAWRVTYSAVLAEGTELLTVVQAPDRPPSYEWVRQTAAGGETRREAGPGGGFEAFAGTDFWWTDLGLGFLHWPGQQLVKEEMSNGRRCVVLDSTPSGEAGYARIRSWIDVEHHALLRAEAYDSKGLLIKEFSTGSFRQVERPDGSVVWFLKDLRIRDLRADSRTELVYDLPGD